MDNKSISIQCDEATKNMMSELQDDMVNSLSGVSKRMAVEVSEKMKPLISKIHEIKNGFEDFSEDNEELYGKIDELNKNIGNITNVIEVTIESSIIKLMNEQTKMILEHNKLFNSNLHNIIESSEEIKKMSEKSSEDLISCKDEIIDKVSKMDTSKLEGEVSAMKEDITSKLDKINIPDLEDKLAILGLKIVKDASANKDEIMNKINELNDDELKTQISELSDKVETNLFTSRQEILNNVSEIKDKMYEKDELISIINKLENEFEQKLSDIKDEVQWGNRSIFKRIFGRKQKQNDETDEEIME